MPSVNPLEKKREAETMKILPRQQKTAVVFLAIVTIGIIVIWSLQLNSQLKSPYGTDKPIASSTVATTTDTTDPHLKDTDGDGLSDYDEINVYHTSPYLEDTDGDGIPDKQEIIQGTDPNCPTGQDCSVQEAPLATTTNSIASSTLDAIDPTAGVTSDPTQADSVGTVTPAMLRQILLQNGYDQATLDKISDADIMSSYQQAMQSSTSTSDISQ
jgi:hypothetical protein